MLPLEQVTFIKKEPQATEVDVPTMLELQCNAVELMRLRHELLIAVSECKMLEAQLLH